MTDRIPANLNDRVNRYRYFTFTTIVIHYELLNLMCSNRTWELIVQPCNLPTQKLNEYIVEPIKLFRGFYIYI